MFIWLACNVAYYITIIEVVDNNGAGQTYHDSDSGYLAGFSIYLACLVIFRITFATIYICKWKFRYCCGKEYNVATRNLKLEMKNIKKTGNGESSDDEILEEQLNKVFEKNSDAIGRRLDETRALATEGDEMSRRHDETLAFISRKQAREEQESDEDYDFRELEDAEVEEAEDRIYSEYKNLRDEGRVMDDQMME